MPQLPDYAQNGLASAINYVLPDTFGNVRLHYINQPTDSSTVDCDHSFPIILIHGIGTDVVLACGIQYVFNYT